MDFKDKTDWLKSLKVGDKVAIYGRDNVYARKICRITDTMIIVELYAATEDKKAIEMRFSIKTGIEINNDTWNKSLIEPYTEEIKLEIRRKNLIHRLGKMDWKQFTTENLGLIYDMVEKTIFTQPDGENK